MHSKRKTFILMVCAVALAVVSAGSTLAYLTSTSLLTNVFSLSKVSVALSESDTDTAENGDGNPLTNTYVMELNDTDGIVKDPCVTIDENSADCWVFVELTESSNPVFSEYLSYTLTQGWQALPGHAGVYYQHIVSSSDTTKLQVIAGNTLTVNAGVTQETLNSLKNTGWPTLTITAYAMQSAGFSNAADAWAQICSDVAV